MEEKIGISAEELLKNTFRRLSEINSCQEIVFPSRVSVIIADDSDIHRIRHGYMGYEKSIMIRFNGGKTWTMSFGKAWGDYPANLYDSDIVAIEILSPEEKTGKDIADEIQNIIHIGEYFEHSLIVARSNGVITVAGNPKNRFRKKYLRSCVPSLRNS